MANNKVRISKEYQKDDLTDCWNWCKATSKYGYGTLKVGGKQWRAHRYYYEKYVGKIPEGLTIDHLCRNKKCVNPEHLEAVTLGENCRRRLSTKLDRLKVENIRKMCEEGFTQKNIAKIYNINQDHVSRIKNGLRWNEETIK